MSLSISVSDFETICRVCMKSKKRMQNIFEHKIDDSIKEFMKMEVDIEDCLPKNICNGCNFQIIKFMDLVSQAKSSYDILQKLLQSSKNSIDDSREVVNVNSSEDLGLNNIDEELYVITVPEAKNNSIFIKPLKLSQINFELKNLCQVIVKKTSLDHTYPKSCSEIQMNANETIFANLSIRNEVLVDSENNLLNDTEQENDNVDPNIIEGYSISFTNYENQIPEINSKVRKEYHVFKMNMDYCTCALCNLTGTTPECISHAEREHTFVNNSQLSLKYICPVCVQTFPDETNFLSHLMIHQQDNVFFVKVDGSGEPMHIEANEAVFTTMTRVSKLMKSEMTSETDVTQLPDLSKTVKEEFVDLDRIFKITELLACGDCDFEAMSFPSLQSHYIEAHSKGMPETSEFFSCPVCEFVTVKNLDYLDSGRLEYYSHLKIHKNEGCHFLKVRRNDSLIDPESFELDLFTPSSQLCHLYYSADEAAVADNTTNYSEEISNLEKSFHPSVVMWNPKVVLLQNGNGTFGTFEKEKKKYTCDICQETFGKKQEIIVHLKTHKNNGFVCEICGKSFVGKRNYSKHFATHPKTDMLISKKPQCPVCLKSFSSKTKLNVHLATHVDEGVSEVQLQSHSLSAICEICGKRFSSTASLSKHKRLHNSDKENKLQTCTLCQRTFPRQASFDRHMSAHLNPNYFECKICRFPLNSLTSFMRHTDSHLSGSSQTFDCNVCHVSFLTKESLTGHQAHTGHNLNREPLECNVCQETFLVGKEFSQHIKTHPKYKLSECNICGKKLATVQSLMMHRDRHFEANSILCPHCGKKFFEEKNYNRHLLTHKGIKPFSCDVEGCEKSFYTVFELKRHKKYHDGTRDFSCSFCPKKFHEANHLKVHERSHTGERPYTCPHCHQSYVTRTRCKQHIKLIHQGIGYDLIQSNISKRVVACKQPN